MDLKDFVAATLTQIVEGVAASASAVSELGGAVSPSYHAKGDLLGTTRDGASHPVHAVSFDVAVVASSAGSQEGGARLEVAGFGGFGAKKGSESKEQVTSRVQFTVPLQLPVDPKSNEAAMKVLAEAQARRRAEQARVDNFNQGRGSWMGR